MRYVNVDQRFHYILFFFNPVQAGRTCPKTWQGCDKEDARGQLYKRGGEGVKDAR